VTSAFVIRFLVLAFAAFGVAAITSSLVVAAGWQLRQTFASRERTAAGRADWLWRLRLLPAAVAISAGVFAAIGLWRFEARHTDEQLGWVIRGCATMGVLFMSAFFVRLFQMHRETRRLLSAWLASAQRLELPARTGLSVPAYRIDTQFPVVAVVGIVRPTLVVDAVVLDTCSPEQLTAILAHEQGHLRRWDNLRRALFAATPDLLAWTLVGPALRDAWREATEEAADDVAAETGEDARVHLADALLRVARLGQGSMVAASTTFRATQLPASALYRGESVERRVRRLLAPAESGQEPRRPWGVAAVAAIATVGLIFQRELHDVMERAVQYLW